MDSSVALSVSFVLFGFTVMYVKLSLTRACIFRIVAS